MDKLCQEYHHDYYPIRTALEQRGITINTTAGPMKLAKKIYAINPLTLEIEQEFESISAAARAICEPGHNPRAVGNHISKYKDTATISHGFLWKTSINN